MVLRATGVFEKIIAKENYVLSLLSQVSRLFAVNNTILYIYFCAYASAHLRVCICNRHAYISISRQKIFLFDILGLLIVQNYLKKHAISHAVSYNQPENSVKNKRILN